MIVRELFARLGMKTDAASFKKADGALQKIKRVAAATATILAAGKVAFSLKNTILETTALADAVAKTSAKLGIGVQALQEYQYAAGLSGVPIRTFNMGLQRFTRRTAEAAMGTGEAKDALKKMGIQLKDSNGMLRPAEDLLLDVADSLSQVTNEGEQVRLAFKLFDSEGVSMINMLKDGSKGLLEMRKRAQEVGGIFSEKFAKASEETTDKLGDMDKGLLSLKIAITEKLRPAFDWLIDKLGQGYRFIARIVKETNILEAALGVLGAAAAIAGGYLLFAFAGPIATGLLLAGVLALIVLAVDDIITSFKGGDSVGRRFTDTMGDLYESFLDLGKGVPIIEALLAPLKAFLAALKLSKDALFALVMLMTGDTSGLKTVMEDAKKTAWDLYEPINKLGLEFEEWAGLRAPAAGAGGGGVLATPGILPQAGAAGVGTSITNAPQIQVTTNVTTQPGQDGKEIGQNIMNTVRRALSDAVKDTATDLLPSVGD